MTAPFMPGMFRTFVDAQKALDFVCEIYDTNTKHILGALTRFVAGQDPQGKIEACYPYVALETDCPIKIDTRLAYGYLAETGRYSATLTRPDIFKRYYKEQFELLLTNHGKPIEIGVSSTPIPLHFAIQTGAHVEGGLERERVTLLHSLFTVPDLATLDDRIANGTFIPQEGEDKPLSLFTAQRVDYSLQRLRHYTGTDPADFQSFVIFTNYQFYVDEFVRLSRELAQAHPDTQDEEHVVLVEPATMPGTSGRTSLPQMPAYHLKRQDGRGITMINIGVGPSNARTITDHVAVLRPDAWIMLGHCAGLRKTQTLGDYVLAHAYVRDDHVLDQELPLWVPIPALAEVQRAIEGAVADVTGHDGYDLKFVMRTGTVVSTDNRNWEISGFSTLVERFSQSRAIALDMESAVLAANGYRFRVPYGTLLCVSDRPLHGEIKLPGMATHFYQKQVSQHLVIGLKAIERLRQNGSETLHSRKLRSFSDTAFR